MGKGPGTHAATAGFCGACGTALRPSARFCPSCGSPTTFEVAPEPTARSRRPLWIALGVLGVAVVAASVLASQRSGDPATAVELDTADAADAIGCSSPCDVTGVVAFNHPTWGPSNLISSGTEGGDYQLDVVDAGGSVVWTQAFGTNWYELAPHDPSIDDTGHLFVDFNPGRYNGVIVLAPVDDGFEDFDTLPAYGDYNTRFYYAEAVDTDGDGTLEVEVSANDCDPSCADGDITSTVYAWDGEDYR